MIATFLRTSPRYDVLLEVFGTDKVQVLPFENGVQDGNVYKIDLVALDDAQRRRLTVYLSNRWKVAGDVVSKWLEDPAHGVPVFVGDVAVVGDLF